MTEAELQDAVIAMARLHGWLIAHFRPARTAHGWRTPVAADGKGFPDLILARDRLVAAELKIHPRKVTAEQREWLDALDQAGVETYVWTDRDWLTGRIDSVLQPRRAA